MAKTLSFLMLGFFALGSAAQAGMPSFTVADFRNVVSDPASNPRRLEALSFFFVLFLVSGFGVQRIWNSLRHEFPLLPRISYGKSLGVVTLWGLLFTLILTMISGARELMTPGAWEKKGAIHRLAGDPSLVAEEQISARYQALLQLAKRLFLYAEEHNKSFPPPPATNEIPDRLWQMPGTSGERYVYMGGTEMGEDYVNEPQPVAYESDAYGPDRLVIMSDGDILWMPISKITSLLKKERP